MRKYGAARSVITGGFIRRYAAAWLFDYAADFPLPLGPLGVDAPPRLGHSVGAGFPYRAGPLSSRLPCVAGFFSTANARGPVLPFGSRSCWGCNPAGCGLPMHAR